MEEYIVNQIHSTNKIVVVSDEVTFQVFFAFFYPHLLSSSQHTLKRKGIFLKALFMFNSFPLRNLHKSWFFSDLFFYVSMKFSLL